MLVPERHTEEGFEFHFCLNYLGHFLLTNLLLDIMKKSGKHGQCSRIVNMSSATHYSGIMLMNDLNRRYKLLPASKITQIKFMFISKCDDRLFLICRNYYSSHGAYAQSKLALVLFTYYLQEQMTAGGFPVTVNAVDPGMVDTALYDNLWSLAKAAKKPVAKFLFRVTIIHLKYLLVLGFLFVFAFNLHYQPRLVASNMHFCCH